MHWQIYDGAGQVMMKGTGPVRTQLSLDTGWLHAGLYLLECRTGALRLSHRFLKVR
jgi:hypothetical protein